MADVSWGTLNVQDASKIGVFQAGEAITAGDACFISSGNSRAECDTTDAEADIKILAITAAAADGNYFIGIKSGSQIGSSGTPFTKGGVYVLSATAGKIAPVADLVTTNRTTIVGFASSTTVLDLNFIATAIAQP